MLDGGTSVKVLMLIGTRPEAIKMAPVVDHLATALWAEAEVISTGQHREMLDQVFTLFGIRPAVDLELMQHGQSLSDLAGNALKVIGRVLEERRPDLLLVQGDTTTAAMGALAGFYGRVSVGHVEAGLRSFNNDDPFPEEVNRRLASLAVRLHFAPTERARQNLLREGVRDPAITVTGNTVIDALMATSRNPRMAEVCLPVTPEAGKRVILVTLHRRESWGEPIAAVCRSLRTVLDRFPDVSVLLPMHRNPIVRVAVVAALGGHLRAHLVEPLDYLAFVKAMTIAHFILTDSGGVQEEAPGLSKPVLIVRKTTERPEALEAGTARLVGTDAGDVLAAMTELLEDEAAYTAMAHAANPFGDGRAAERIVETIRRFSAVSLPAQMQHGPT